MAKRARAEGASNVQWMPPVDLCRSGEELVLTISLPGLRPEDFRVFLSGNREICLEGLRHYRHPVPQEYLALSERPYGPFARKVPLPLPVTAGRAKVTFEQGVLTARLPIEADRVQLRWHGEGG